MGTFEKCFLCIIYSILIIIHDPLPFVLEAKISIVLPRLVTFMDSSASLIIPSKIPGTIGPHYHCTAIIPFKGKKPWYTEAL